MKARDYYGWVQGIIQQASYVLSVEMSYEEIDREECYIRGKLHLIGDFVLHFAEYVITEPEVHRLKYRYHLQDGRGRMVVRWDNAPHHRHVTTFPHHRHEADGRVRASSAMDLDAVLQSIVAYL